MPPGAGGEAAARSSDKEDIHDEYLKLMMFIMIKHKYVLNRVNSYRHPEPMLESRPLSRLWRQSRFGPDQSKDSLCQWSFSGTFV